jgi:hypothetical protein
MAACATGFRPGSGDLISCPDKRKVAMIAGNADRASLPGQLAEHPQR